MRMQRGQLRQNRVDNRSGIRSIVLYTGQAVNRRLILPGSHDLYSQMNQRIGMRRVDFDLPPGVFGCLGRITGGVFIREAKLVVGIGMHGGQFNGLP